MCDALLPINLMKCQYFLAELASRSMFPISSENVLVAVSKPNEISISSFFRSPSIVLGQPITWIPHLWAAKYSASTAALVLESSPPMITIAFRSCSFATLATTSNCSSFSSFVLPDPMISKPPVFLYSLIYSSVNTMKSLSIKPEGPFLNPRSTLSLLAFLSASYRPDTTLCPPGAWPPERITPTTCFLFSAVLFPSLKLISGMP